MHFINNTELAGIVDAGMAETEVTKSTVGTVTTTTIYAGYPTIREVQPAPPFSQNANGDLLQDGGSVTTAPTWRIRRTVVVEDGDTTTVSTRWAEGDWANRTTLNYKYL